MKKSFLIILAAAFAAILAWWLLRARLAHPQDLIQSIQDEPRAVKTVPPLASLPPSPGARPPASNLVQSPPASALPAKSPPAVTSTLPSPATTSAEPPPLYPPEILLDNMRNTVRQYGLMFGGNPVGTNLEITKALNGDNPKQVKFLGPDGNRVNQKGELVDVWGTPYFFHQLSAMEMEIRSAGPDKIMYTSDDLVTK